MPRKREERVRQAVFDAGCPDLASKLAKGRGARLRVQSTGSLNGRRTENAYRQTMAELLNSGLRGKGIDAIRRAIDLEFGKRGLSINVAERDRLAHVLNEGGWQKRGR